MSNKFNLFIGVFDRDQHEGPRVFQLMHSVSRKLILPILTLATSIALGQSPESRGHFAVAYDETLGKVALMGGVQITEGRLFLFDDYWLWNGKNWAKQGNTRLPVMGSRMVYEPERRRMLMLAGSGARAPERGDLRALVAGEWVTLAGAPELKGVDPGLAFDTKRNRVIAFIPGPNGNDPKTFEWDGRIWRPGKGKSPVGHQGASMVYDPKRGVVVLFGGHGIDRKPTNDVWEYDGLGWKQFIVAGPPERRYAGIAYNDKLGAVVVHGGMGDDSKWLGDTWAWDGKSWKMLSDKGPALELGLAYDKARDRLVVVGTDTHENTNSRLQTWEFDGTDWMKIG